MCIESTTDDDCKRLHDATDLIEEGERERETITCVCEGDTIIIIVLDQRTRDVSRISSFSMSRLFMKFGRTNACIQ